MATSKREKTERRALVEKMQREQKAKERRRTLISTSVLVIVLGALVVAVYFGLNKDKKPAVVGKQIVPAAVTGTTTVEKKPAIVPNTTGVDGVIAYDTKGYPGPGTTDAGTLTHDHVQGPVTYAVTPPVGGPHNGIWMNAGIYTSPVPTERAVHNLEHGAIWITYNPNLPAKDVDELRAFVLKQSMISESGGQANRYMDLTPWATNTLPSPIVLSSWGYQLQVTSPTDPRMQKFVDTFRHNQKYTPEYGAAVDGVPVQTGGQPALGGSKFANPTGSAN